MLQIINIKIVLYACAMQQSGMQQLYLGQTTLLNMRMPAVAP